MKGDQKPAKYEYRTVNLSLAVIYILFHNQPGQRLLLHCRLKTMSFPLLSKERSVVNTDMQLCYWLLMASDSDEILQDIQGENDNDDEILRDV